MEKDEKYIYESLLKKIYDFIKKRKGDNKHTDSIDLINEIKNYPSFMIMHHVHKLEKMDVIKHRNVRFNLTTYDIIKHYE